MTYDEISNLLQIITGVILTLSFFAGIATIWITLKANKEKDAKAAEQQARIAQLANDTAKANEATERLKIEAAEAKERQAAAEQELLKLRERLSPRTLDDNQKLHLLQKLDKHPKSAIEIKFLGSDLESMHFATQIFDVFNKLGWHTEYTRSIEPLDAGILLIVPSVTDTVREIITAFRTTDIEIDCKFINEQPSDQLILTVGEKQMFGYAYYRQQSQNRPS